MAGRMVRIAAILLILLVFVGCAQNTAAPVEQPSRQVQAPVSDQAAQGSSSNVEIYVLNAPGENRVPNAGGPIIAVGEDGRLAQLASVDTNGTGNGVRDTRAGYTIAGLTFNIQTGGSSTGPQTTGGVSGQTAQPGATITQSPEQRPEASVQVPVAFAQPGGAANANAAGATGGGNPNLTTEQQAELRTALLKAAQAGDTNAVKLLEQLFGIVAPPESPPGQ